MERMKARWSRLPRRIRRPIVIVIGFLFVIAAGLTGWLPGPGGIPLFLLGVAILATEYAWAERFRDFILDLVKTAGRWIRNHPVIGRILIVWTVLCMILVGYSGYLFFGPR